MDKKQFTMFLQGNLFSPFNSYVSMFCNNRKLEDCLSQEAFILNFYCQPDYYRTRKIGKNASKRN